MSNDTGVSQSKENLEDKDIRLDPLKRVRGIQHI